LLDDLESEIKKIPSKVQSLQAKLKRATVKQDKLQAILPDKKRADELRREVNLCENGPVVRSIPLLTFLFYL
jgi:hypothetical protein